MSGIFPASWDGGIPPNAQTPENPPQAFLPDHYAMPPDTSPLYYGMGCDIRIRAPVLNSIISEVIAVCDRAGFAYRADSLRNLVTAIMYLIERGRSGVMIRQSAPTLYTIELDPAPVKYTDFMTLTLVPDQANVGLVRINVNRLGEAPLLSKTGAEMAAGELRANVPFMCCYFGEVFTPTALGPLPANAPPVPGRFYKVSA